MPYDPLGSQPFDLFRGVDMQFDAPVASTSTFSPTSVQTGSDWSFSSGAPAWSRAPQGMPEPQPVASTSQPCECADCHAAVAGLRSPPSAHGPLPNGLPTMFLSGAFAAQPGPLQVRPNPPRQPQQTDMLRLPNLSPIPTQPPQIQYNQQPYNPLNFLAPGYLPAPFINNGQINTTSYVYAPQPTALGYGDGGTRTAEQTLLSRSRPQLAPIATGPAAPGLPVSQAVPNSTGPSPRRRSNPSDTSPHASDTSPTTGDSGNEDRIESPTPFVNKLHFLLSNPEYDCIRWTPDGRSFVFAASSPDLITAFAQVFRHRNTNSFVRQLNIYNFKRLSGVELHDALAGSPQGPYATSDYTGFTHSLFFRDAPGQRCDLGKIKPTKGKHYSAARRSSAGSLGGPVSAGGVNKAHVLRGKGKVGGSIPGDEADRKYSVSG